MLETYARDSNRLLFWLLLLLLMALLYNLGGWGVVETSEARYAEISREMWLTGDYLHPRLLGIQHYHKPPLTYIISAFGMELFGPSAFGARFFLQLSLILQALLVYVIGKEIFGNSKQALTAAIIYLTIPAVLLAARNLTTDSFLTTFELAAIWSWIKYRKDTKAAWLYFFYLLLALAFLTKGPVGLIFPVLIAFGYSRPKTESINRSSGWHHLPALLLFLVVGASWYVYLMLQNPDFVDYFLFKHTVQRYANPETFGRSKPWWFYLVLAPALSLPWAAILLIKLKKLKELPTPLKRLFILWILVPLVFFSFSGSKLILYILPLFAGQALLTAWLLYQLAPESMAKATKGSILYFLVLAIVLLLVPLLPIGIKLPYWVYIFPVLMLAVLFLLWKRPAAALTKLLASALAFILLLLPYSTHLMGSNPQLMKGSRPIAQIIQNKQLQNRTILVYDNLLPSLAFELNKSIISIKEKSRHLHREIQFETDEKWQRGLLDINEPAAVTQLQTLLLQPTVLVVKDELPKKQEWFLKHYRNSQKSGRWTVYY
ncbi:ArnT family glycosyltransferase [Pontibacter sp. H249]|uniref:ArnT family glycosyltransferase n=1 Tax=Pontibacter sp. H249 TaxID=3133420 RepID=UPI0030BC44EE